MYIYLYTWKTEASVCLPTTERGSNFPWPANDKRLLMFAVSANVLIYDSYEH